MQSFHAQDEIFKTDHFQARVSSKAVIWTCAVLPLGKWIAFLDSGGHPSGRIRQPGPVPPDEVCPAADLAGCMGLGRQQLLLKSRIV